MARIGGWADEIDFEGFDLFSEDEYQNELEKFEKLAKENASCETYVGTNEEQELEAEQVLNDLKRAEVIDIDEHAFLFDHFGEHYGDTYYGWWDDENEYDEDDDEDEED